MERTSGVHGSPGGRRRLASVLAGLLVAAALLASLASFALADAPSFPDVPATHQNYAAISDLASRGIVNGYANGYFGPDNGVTRQQFAKMIVLTMGLEVPADIVCPFGDVDQTPGTADPLYPAKYVAVCALHGITQGKSPALFDPYANISRYQVLTMVVRAVDHAHAGLLLALPDDFVPSWDPALSPQHGANAARAEYNLLLADVDLAGLDPQGNMTRAEIAQVLHNLLAILSSTTTTEAPTTTVDPGAASSTTSTTAPCG